MGNAYKSIERREAFIGTHKEGSSYNLRSINRYNKLNCGTNFAYLREEGNEECISCHQISTGWCVYR